MLEIRSTFAVLVASAMTLTFFATPAVAQSTWTGLAGNGNWNQAANWSPSGAPASGSALVFSGTNRTTATNNLATGTSFASILFANDGSVGKTAGFTLSGSAFKLTSGSITAASTSGTAITNTLNLEITFPTTATFSIGANQTVSTRGGKGFTIQGGNGLVKTGAGILELGMANTLTGSVSLQAGTLRVFGSGSSVDPFGSSTGVNFDASGVRLQFDSYDYSIAAPINVNESGTISLTKNTAMAITTGTITLSAGRTLSLVAGNSGSGTDFQHTLSSPFVTLGSGTLSFGGGNNRIGMTLAGTTTLGGNLTVESLNTTGTTIFNAPITDGAGSYGVTFIGTKFITLSASNAYHGDTIISQTTGVVSLSNASAIPSGAGRGNFSMSPASGTATLDLNGSSIQLNGFSSSGAGQSVIDNTAGTAATLTIGANDGTGTFGGVIRNTSGTVSLVKTGGGSITLSGSNSFTGSTSVNAGTLSLGVNNALPATSAVSLAGSTLTVGGYTNTIGSLSTSNQPPSAMSREPWIGRLLVEPKNGLRSRWT